MKKINTNEIVIEYLLSLGRDYNGGKLTVDITRDKFNIPNMTEEELMNELSLLESDRLISVNFPTGHRDLSHYITVTLMSLILHYFDDKKHRKTMEKNNWIQFLIPISVSIISLIASIIISLSQQ